MFLFNSGLHSNAQFYLFQATYLQYQDVMMLMNVRTVMATVNIPATTHWDPITAYVTMASASVTMDLTVSMSTSVKLRVHIIVLSYASMKMVVIHALV